MRTGFRFRRLIWVAAALALLLGFAYARLTRPEALRTRLVALVEGFDLNVVRIGDISFSLVTGLEVLDLEVAANDGASLAGGVEPRDHPPLLRVPRARVTADPWMLVLGEFQPRDVELDAPAIAVIWPDGERSPRTLQWNGRLPLPAEIPANVPQVRIHQADLRLLSVEDGQLRVRKRWVVDGRGALTGGDEAEPRAYVLRFDQVGGVAPASQMRSAALARLRLQAGRLVAELGWIDLGAEQVLIPERWAELVRPLHLAGQVRATQVVLDAGGLVSAEIEGDRLSCMIPIETDIGDPEQECFARLTDATGTIRFDRGPPPTTSQSAQPRGHVKARLAGRLNDADATVDLSVDSISHHPQAGAGARDRTVADVRDDFEFGPYRMEAHIDGLTLPTLRDNPRFVTSERLPESLRSWIRRYDADGRVNLSAALEGGGSNEHLRYQGSIEALDGSCRYFRFPYRIADARGLVRFSNDGIVFEGLRGRHGAGRIRLDGHLVDSTSSTGFELSFRGHNVGSDADLYTALPPAYQALWRSAAPVGLWDVQVRLERAHSPVETNAHPTEVRVDARLLAGSLELDDGRVLENADGLVHIAEGRVELDNVRGYLDGALVCVNGTLQSGADNEGPRYNVHVEVAGAKLQRASEVRDEKGDFIGQFEFQGVGDVWGQLSSAGRGQNHSVVHITDGVLTGFDGRRPWSQATGWISLRADEQQIHSLTARRDTGSVSICGALPTKLGLHSPVELDLRATDEDFERALRQLVPERWSGIREALGPAGAGKLSARLYPQAVAGAEQRQAAEIQLEIERLRPTPLPLDLRDIRARLTLHAEGFELHEAAARYGQRGRLAVDGRGGWLPDGTWADIQAEGRDLELDAELIRAMPKPLADLLNRMAAVGRVQLKLDQVRLRTAEQREWNVVGRIGLDHAQLNVGLPLTEFAGHLEGSCGIGSEGSLGLDARFAIERGRLADRPIERWEGRISRRPDASRVRLEGVRGRLCGGEVVGFAEIDPETATYELSFTLHDVELGQFARSAQDQPAQPTPGRLDGHIFVRGSLEDPARRSGGGELRVRGTSLLSSPVTASVVEASRRQDRFISNEVEQAEIRFVWEGQELKLTRVDIHSPDLRMIGAGSWNMRNDAIALTLLGATPEDAPRLFVLTDLIESAGQELIQYRVEGTRAEPRVTIEPFHNLTDPLRRLLKGE